MRRYRSIVLVLTNFVIHSALFVAGSPLAMFMLLDQRQLIARKGRARTKDAKPDEAVSVYQLRFLSITADAVAAPDRSQRRLWLSLGRLDLQRLLSLRPHSVRQQSFKLPVR